MYPILCLSSVLSLRGFNPITRAVPPEGRSAPTRPLIRVVFPAPFGPTRPNTSPLPTERSVPPTLRPGRTSWSIRRPLWNSPLVLLPCETPQEDADHCFYVFLVGEAVFPYGREEHLAPSLGEKHPYKRPGAGPYVVRPEPAQLDLTRHVTLQEPEYPFDHRVAEHLRDLRPPHGFTNEQPRHPLGGTIVERREVPPGDVR